MSKHVLSHTRLKQYLCDICSKEFTVRAEFIKHKKGHDNNNHSIDLSTNNSTTANNSFSGDQNQNMDFDAEKRSIILSHRRESDKFFNTLQQNGGQVVMSTTFGGGRTISSTTPPSLGSRQVSSSTMSPERRTKPLQDGSKRANLMDTINRLNMLKAGHGSPTSAKRLHSPQQLSAQQLT